MCFRGGQFSGLEKKNFWDVLFAISTSQKVALKQDRDNIGEKMPAARDVLLRQQANNGHKLSKALC